MTTKTKDASTTHAEIERLAKEQAVQAMRLIERIDIGQVVRQGDIYIHHVPDDSARGALRKGEGARQLAFGDTQGSRHIAKAPAKVYEGTTLPQYADPRTLLGPCVVSNKRFVIEHPEHAHISLPAGTYQITHQMDARTLQRVRD